MMRYFFILFFLLIVATEAFAACDYPEGNEADIVYNDDHNVFQFCNGIEWVRFGENHHVSRADGLPGTDCVVGKKGMGGIYAFCSDDADLIVMPAWCETDTYEPDPCDGTNIVERNRTVWGMRGTWVGNAYKYSGPEAHQKVMEEVEKQGVGSHPAAEWCEAMVLGGYNDWYLPGKADLIYLNRATRASIGDISMTLNADYWAATERSSDANDACNIYMDDILFPDMQSCSGGSDDRMKSGHVRCVRQQYKKAPEATITE